MKTALKVVMIIFGAVLIIEGLLDIVIPEQRAMLLGIGDGAGYVMFYMTLLGATWVAVGFWVLVAGLNPLQHLFWVRFSITLPVLLSLILGYSSIRGYVSFDLVAIDLIMNIVFALTFLVLYPWRASSGTGQETVK